LGASGGWTLARVAALSLVVALLAPVNPMLLVTVPLAVMLLAFQPGRVLSFLLAVFLLWLAFLPVEGTTPLWYGERAWSLIAAGAFVLATLAWPNARLALRSIAAVALGFVGFALYGLVRPESLDRLDWWMASELRWTARVVAGWMSAAEPDTLVGTLAASVEDMVELQIVLYPSLLALATIAALGIAWFITVRLAGSEGAVGPLREFRFNDQLIWVMIGGLVLFLLPVGQLAGRVGQNALAFMGGLYVLRGAAILVWIMPAVAISAWWVLLWAMLALLFYPLVLGLALVLGVSDTWLDLRARLSGSEGTHGST
jgi:hypothetical protein